jgi:SNF2 family DNA or RNA helicase
LAVQTDETQSTKLTHLHNEILPDFVKDIVTSKTIVLTSTNSLADLYGGDYTQIPIEDADALLRRAQPPTKSKTSEEDRTEKKKKKKKRFKDYDKRETRWETVAADALPGRGLLQYRDSTMVLVHDFLGSQRTELIVSIPLCHLSGSELTGQLKLHDADRIQSISSLPHLSPNIQLHSWQKTGAWKMVTSCQGPVRGVLNVSTMGTGKTMETLFALEYARLVSKVPGSFDLVLTPLSCVGQWVREAERMFVPVRLALPEKVFHC